MTMVGPSRWITERDNYVGAIRVRGDHLKRQVNEAHQRMTSSITARSSPLVLGMEMRRLAIATISSLLMRSTGTRLRH